MHKPATTTAVRSNRVIVIDDNVAIHADIRKILCPHVSAASAAVDALEAELLDEPGAPVHRETEKFELDSAHQGREGLAIVQEAIAAGRPHAMAFVDVRMPPGWDGVETTLELWKVAPDLQIVICTAYSDYSWDEMLAKIGGTDRLVILKKPFDTIEVLQLANALTAKWNLLQLSRADAAALESRVRLRTADLEAANASLHEEIGRRILVEFDLKRAKEAAESADVAKGAFLANMSHEIRTPMNGVIGMGNLLLGTPLNADQRDLVQTLCQSGEALLVIINDILDFSKIEAGRLVLESIDFSLAEQLELALDLQADAAQRKGLELVMDIDPVVPARVRGDPVRLRQVVLNLLGNAIKFTPGGEVVLRVGLERAMPGRTLLRFEITDTGIGIPEATRAALFQPFMQADASTTRRFGGTGLGLAICRRLATLMRGEIGVRNNAGTGSTFWFTALLDEPEEPAAGFALTTAHFDGHRALLVDDNATNRNLLQKFCQQWRLRQATAASAAEALALLRAATADPFDLVILDHHLPDSDGLALAKTIQADAAIHRPTMVLLTTRGERLTQSALTAHSLAAIELKPLHAEKLRSTLDRALAGSRGGTQVPPSAAENATPPLPAGDTAILIAEDNPVNQKVTLLQLRSLGHAADVVQNGREALEALRRRPYALVLMDQQMPIMDGVEATRLIRAAQAAREAGFNREIHIIAMTANAMNGDRDACLKAGMDDYLPKPVRPQALREVISRYLTVTAVAEVA